MLLKNALSFFCQSVLQTSEIVNSVDLMKHLKIPFGSSGPGITAKVTKVRYKTKNLLVYLHTYTCLCKLLTS